MGSVSDTNHSSILIVGAGIFGTSTAYHLSRSHPSPSSITVLDRAPFPSPQAASSDINKIIRADYTIPFYMSLAYEALDAWSTSDILKPFYRRTGWVMIPESDSDIAERTRQNFKNSGRQDPSSDISPEDIRKQWGGVFKDIDLNDCGQSYWNPEAGRADASEAVKAMIDVAVNNGIRYEVGEVAELVPSESGLKGVRTTKGKLYTADKILLATGAWTPWLMSPVEDHLHIPDSDRTDKQLLAAGVVTAAFELTTTEASQYANMPVLVYGEKGEVMPTFHPDSALIKFTNSYTFSNHETLPSGRQISVPPLSLPQTHVPDPLKEESLKLIHQRIPSILSHNREPEWRICWDVLSPTQNQLITQHPDPRLSNLYFATAGSFHSWKFLPTIGKYVVNVLQGRGNGKEKDEHWMWKKGQEGGRGAHEKVVPKRDFKDLGG